MKICITVIAILFTLSAQAGNWYVRPAAQGSNSGADWNNAWNITSLNSHWSSVQPGDTVWLAGGAYSTKFTQSKSGTSNAWIYVKRVLSTDAVPTAAAGWNSSFDSQVVNTVANAIHLTSSHCGDYTMWDGRIDSGIKLVCNNSNSGSYDAAFRSGEMSGTIINQFVVCTNIEMEGPYYTAIAAGQNYGTYGSAIYLHKATQMKFTKCRIHGWPNFIKMLANNITFDNNWMYDSRMIGDPATQPHPNIIEATGTPGLGYITFSNNRVWNWDAEGIVFGYPDGPYWVYGNVFDATGMPGYPRVIETYPGGASMNQGLLYFYNNTSVNVYWTIITSGTVGPHGDGFAAGTLIRNNLIWNEQAGSGTVSWCSDYDYANMALGEAHSVNGTGATPFANYAGKDYTIRTNVASTYPRNKGTSIANDAGHLFNVDMNGNTRGADGSWDMGAYEYNAGTPATNPPSITVQPVGMTNVVGSTISLSVTATGDGTLAYQWRTNAVAIAGATASTFSKANAATNDSAAYTVRVTNAFGMVTSSVAQVLITNGIPATVTVQPTNKSALIGTTNTFSVTAAGTPPISYVWRYNGNVVSGQTGATASIVGATVSAFNVWCTVNNAFGGETSSNAVYTVTNGPLPVVTGPTNREVLVGQTASFAVTATSTTTTNYFWQWEHGGTWADVGSNLRTWTTPATVLGDSGSNVRCLVSNIYGVTASLTVSLGVTNGNCQITVQPQSASVAAGGTANFSVTAIGNAPITYQWKHAGTNWPGATNSTLSITNVQPAHAGAWTVMASNAYASDTSVEATLTVTGWATPSISVQPQSVTITNGGNATFTVTASGTPAPAYQWRRNGVNLSGATSASYTTNAVPLAASGGQYTVVVTNLYGSLTSAVAVLTVVAGGVAPVITLDPVSQTVGVSGLAHFTVTATGTDPLSYQWTLGAVNIYGATGSTYNISPVTAGHGGSYQAIVANAYGSDTSSIALLTVTNTYVTPPAPQLLRIAP